MEIHVWPGAIVEGEQAQIVLTLVRMIDESMEDYAKRCEDLVSYAFSKIPFMEPPTFDFSDTTRYRQVGPDSWESVTPGENE